MSLLVYSRFHSNMSKPHPSHCIHRCSLIAMADHHREPSFGCHGRWVEQTIQPPSLAELMIAGARLELTDEELPADHVLRGSRSFAARSFRSRTTWNGVRVPSSKSNNENVSAAPSAPPPQPAYSSGALVLGEIANNPHIIRPDSQRIQPSPTASLKRKKAEAIVKAHGSPTHVRVTAGGRIVPSEQSPLCLPRFGYSAIKANGGLIKFAPNHAVGKAAQWTQTLQDGTQDGFVAQDTEGRLCQIVNGTILPLTEVDGALRLYMHAPNLNITQRGPSYGPATVSPAQVEKQDEAIHNERAIPQPNPPPSVQPSIATQTNALGGEYSRLERELKDLDKTEVVHGKTMSRQAREALVGKRRELVITMDNVRKALKSLKEAPQQQTSSYEAPDPPKQAYERVPASPRTAQTPPLSQRLRQRNFSNDTSRFAPPINSFPPGFQPHYFGIAPNVPVPPNFGYPGPESGFSAPQYAMPPPGMFMHPPPFDGSMGLAPGFQSFPDPAYPVPPPQSAFELNMPQNDGTASAIDLKVNSPRQSHTVPLKDPATKQIVNVKSLLNPKSPVYKPASSTRTNASQNDRPVLKSVNDREPTPLGLSQAMSTQPSRLPRGSTGNSTAANTATVNSNSSVSSIKTADFFPRNTRDYSMRKHEYPIPLDGSEGKEKDDPQPRGQPSSEESPATPSRDRHNTNWNPEIPSGAFVNHTSPQSKSYTAPTAPPGTPVSASDNTRPLQLPVRIHGGGLEPTERHSHAHHVPDRDAHNLSPKSRRQWQFVEEHPAMYSSREASCEVEVHDPHDTTMLDFSYKSREWIEGYQAGLQRKPVGADRMGVFLDGYCEGLLKSQPTASNNPNLTASTGSPFKQRSRRSSAVQMPPGPCSSNRGSRQEPAAGGAPIESSTHGVDTLKQAVFAAQNENTILTPAVDGPTVHETAFNLGAWQKQHEAMISSQGDGLAGFPFPERNSSLPRPQEPASDHSSGHHRDSVIMSRQLTQSSIAPAITHAIPQDHSEDHPAAFPRPQPIPRKQVTPSSVPGSRICSVTSADTSVHRPWPVANSNRVLSPFEWKSSSSIAHAANLATGFFSHAQYDGSRSDRQHSDGDRAPILANAAGIAGAPTTNQSGSRFQEASTGGSSSPRSPAPMSPAVSPQISPRATLATQAKIRKESHSPKKDSPGKSSPAKAKFEHIASKVGIKTSSEKKDVDVEPAPSPGRHRWKDIWKGARKDGSKDGAD